MSAKEDRTVHAVKSTLALTLAALAAASSAGAHSSFNGNVCGLLAAKQIAAIPGVSPQCTNAKPSKGLGSTISLGNWAGKTPRSPHLQITVSLYTDAGALQLAKRNLDQGLPATPRKVAGIGVGAYEAIGASAAGIHFAVGKDVVYISLNTIGAPPRSTASVEAVARAVAAKL
jgi:hypothetical protein